MMNIVDDLMRFVNNKLGSIENLETMTNSIEPDKIFFRYKKFHYDGNDLKEEYKIGQVDENGNVTFIDSQFKNMFERYQFLSECQVFDIKDSEAYLIVD